MSDNQNINEGLPSNARGSNSLMKIFLGLAVMVFLAGAGYFANKFVQNTTSTKKQDNTRKVSDSPIPREFVAPVVKRKPEPNPEPKQDVEQEPIPIPPASIVNEVVVEVPSINQDAVNSVETDKEISDLREELAKLREEAVNRDNNQEYQDRVDRRAERRAELKAQQELKLAEIEAKKEERIAQIEAISNRKLSSDLVGEEVKKTEPKGIGQSPNNSALAERLQTTSFKSSSASRIHNMTMKILKGTMIPCVLQTRLVSSMPGFVSCVVTDDIKGADGKVSLVDKGTKVFGEYQKGLTKGQSRLFVTWTELVTPEGVRIPLGSPATGALGEAGIGGYVDRHYLRRFMGAVLVSLIDDKINQQANNNNLNNQNTVKQGATQTQKLIEEMVNLPATLYKRHGSRALVFVARDLDFSGIYDLQ